LVLTDLKPLDEAGSDGGYVFSQPDHTADTGGSHEFGEIVTYQYY
jgi:hypothetical protein